MISFNWLRKISSSPLAKAKADTKFYMSSTSGFSMVELSLVLTIVGITLAGALDLATNKTESSRITETNARIAAIEQALAAYLIENQRLPCPADATLPLSNANAGKENAAHLTTCVGSNFSSGTVVMGAVPTKSLNLTDRYMSDDWDRRFSYAVDYRFTNNFTNNASCGTDSNCFQKATAGSIIIQDSASGSAISSEGVYAIISHGKNGYGAWKYSGNATRLSASTDTDEKENAGSDRTTAVAGFNNIFIKKSSTTTYDDITTYSTKSLIITTVAGITDATTCTAAFDAKPKTGAGTDPCEGLGAATNCYSLATQVDNLCFQ